MAGGTRSPVLLGLVLMLLLSGLCEAYPALFVNRYAKSCTDHPKQAHMGGRGSGHTAPVKDEGVKFELKVGGKPVTRACPGVPVSVDVTFPLPRFALLTSTVGDFKEGDPWDCPNRVVFDKEHKNTQSATLNIPCSGAPLSTLLQVTSANGEGFSFKQATLTVPIDRSCGKCGGGKSN